MMITVMSFKKVLSRRFDLRVKVGVSLGYGPIHCIYTIQTEIYQTPTGSLNQVYESYFMILILKRIKA